MNVSQEEKQYQEITRFTRFQESVTADGLVRIFDISRERALRYIQRMREEDIVWHDETQNGDWAIINEPHKMENTKTPVGYSYEIVIGKLLPPMADYRFVAKISFLYKRKPIGEDESIPDPVGEAWGRSEYEAREKVWKKIELWIRDQEVK